MRTLCGQDYVKDLSRLGRSLGRTVLVDNDPYSGLLQPCNLLPTNAYYGAPSDRWGPERSSVNASDLRSGQGLLCSPGSRTAQCL